MAVTKIAKASELLVTVRDWSKGKFVEQVSGKGLSTNDYTTDEKNKLSGVATGAEVNVIDGVGVKMPGESTYTDIPISSKKGQLDLSNVALKSDITAVLKFKGTKDYVGELPSSGNTVGDVWHVKYRGSSGTEALNAEYVWVESGTPAVGRWEELGAGIDLSGYVPTSRKVNDKALSADVTIDGSDVKLTGYTKGSASTEVAATDSVNEAFAKVQNQVEAKYTKDANGIPKTDLASDVQTSLGKADTALQSETYTGTVTSVRVQATAPVVSSQNTAQTETLNTTISLADGYGDTKNPYAAKTACYVLAGPAKGASDAAPSFRAFVLDDISDMEFMTTSEMETILNS